MEYILYDGYHFAKERTPNHDVLQHLEHLHSLIFSDDEVAVATYPKSGTHWLYEIVNMLKTSRLDYTSRIITTFSVDFQPLESLAKRDYKVFATHYYPRFLPKDFMKKRNKIIYVYRNPKDIIVSVVEQFKKLKVDKKYEIDGVLQNFLQGTLVFGKWLDHIREWENYKRQHPEHPVLMISFEDLKENLLQGVQTISNFLEMDHPKSFIEGVAKKCEFGNMSAYIHSNIPETVKSLSNDFHRQINMFYHKGMVGNWKNVLTVSQNKVINDELSQALQGLESKIRFSL